MQYFRTTISAAFVWGTSFLTMGCGEGELQLEATSTMADMEEVGVATEELVTSNTIIYEGNCSYLGQCSTWSQNGQVKWGCGDGSWPLGISDSPPSQLGCADYYTYVAAPKNTLDNYCGMPVRFCTAAGKCITVRPVDKSADINNRWEGGPAVMQLLGVSSYGQYANCGGGWGATSVTATYGSWDTSKSAPNSTSLAVGGSYTVYFNPNKIGDNAFDFVNNSAVTNGGTLEFCWSSNSSPSWNCWTTDAVTSAWKRRNLYNGTSDVKYRMTFKATKAATFYWRKYTAP